MKPASARPEGARGVTAGTLLDGRVRYHQPAHGHRSGIEPVLLAASIPARAGQVVLEAGTGAGAALLCLGTRVPGLSGIGVDLDPTAAEVARDNFGACDAASLHAVCADIAALPVARASADHAMANPPWHDVAGTPSADAGRERALRGRPGLIAAWVRALASAVRDGGSVTLIARVDAVPSFLEAAARAGLGSPHLLPLWPRDGVPAKLTLMQATKGGRGPLCLLPGLALHHADGSFTAPASAILRDAAPLPFGPTRIRRARSRIGAGTAPVACCTAAAPRRSG